MSAPNKQESQQLASTIRQLERLQKSTDNLYRRMVINGRHRKYSNAACEASELIKKAAERIKEVVNE